ncbi:MAG TPA: EVE domain-containing protein [Candidatus Xenobia bacterium]|nr:EVE domain-containing protein [Candidatus Xenobia bacterium]
MSRHWLFATDPSVYHWDTLFVKGKEMWNHVRSDAALRYFKQVRRGDTVLCYHGPPERSIYAQAVVASDPYPDPYARGKNHLAVDLKAVQRLPRTISFKDMKTNRLLKKMKFLARPRVSVTPVTEHEYNEVLRLAGVSLGPFR